jgi:hypothetical protein
MTYENIREEELKNQIAHIYFNEFDCRQIIGNIDFCVTAQKQFGEIESLLWAEAKKGKADIYKSIVQLILTIGKARTFDKTLPPAYLGAFDSEKIAFIPYNDIQEIFYQNDFNWNVTPSNYETKEFKQVHDKVKTVIDTYSLLFFFGTDDAEIAEFIKTNFVAGKSTTSKIRIDKNNFITIYTKWLTTVKPTIVFNWEIAKKNNIIDGDFYLADLLSSENESLKETLYVLLKKDYYEFEKTLNEMGIFDLKRTSFNDKQKAHTQFWNKYERPPKEQYWDYIVERRDLLVPQDVRERKGSFFTPQIWVELSQKYLTDVLGEDWQDEYYIWDCAAGTGNLLTGLTNKDNIWASTLDRQDVDVIKDRIQNGANLWEKQVFQFDFLNDSFEKLPKELQEIISNPEKREKLVIYINPPYAEATDGIGQGGKKIDVSKETKIYTKYGEILKKAKNELFAQFFARIYKEISGAKIANFSTLKILQSSNFVHFRRFFLAKLEKMFIVPANTFDNVVGQFPIGFMIWDTFQQDEFKQVNTDIYNEQNQLIGNKSILANNEKEYINNWIKQYTNNENNYIGFLAYLGNDFQNTNQVRFSSFKPTSHLSTLALNSKNIILACTYFAIRYSIKATWLNDRDQFLYPNNKWEKDKEFQNDCFTFALFHGQNKISSKYGTNHWIPFTESEVGSKEKFESKFMAHLISGKLKDNTATALFEKDKATKKLPLEFSVEAEAVFKTGKALWSYYHKQPHCNANASLYDIREYFQERNSAGRMNSKSADEIYTKLVAELRESLAVLAKKIEPKVYEYGFLKN